MYYHKHSMGHCLLILSARRFSPCLISLLVSLLLHAPSKQFSLLAQKRGKTDGIQAQTHLPLSINPAQSVLCWLYTISHGFSSRRVIEITTCACKPIYQCHHKAFILPRLGFLGVCPSVCLSVDVCGRHAVAKCSMLK